MWNRIHKQVYIILGVLLSSVLSTIILSQSTFAAAITTIPKSQFEKAAVYESSYKGYMRGAPTQGGIVTKDYYVFSDCQGLYASSCHNGYVRVYKRNDCSAVKKIKTSVRNIKGVYYGWKNEEVTFIGYGGGTSGCLDLSNLKFSNGGGCPAPPGLYYNRGGSPQGAATSFNGYSYKVAGLGEDGYSYLLITGKGKRKEYKLSNKDIKSKTGLKPKYGFEPEDVSVDGSTGDVYISYAYRAKGGHRMILFLRIKSDYFKEFTGLSGSSSYPVCKNSKITSGTSSSDSNSSNPASIYSPTPYNPSNITTRDETYKPGAAQSTYDGTVDTNFFGTIKDEDGCGVYTTLSFILDILSIGIGITAVIGIAIAGSTYLSSKGNVAKTTKAKRRIYEIVIGLIAYAVIYSLLTFLTPEFNPELKVCKALTPEEVAQIKAENEAKIKEAEEKQKAEEAARTKKADSSSTSPEESNNNQNNDNLTNEQIRAQLAATAKKFSGSKSKPNTAYKTAFNQSGLKEFEEALCKDKGYCDSNRQKGKSCSTFVATVVRTVIPSEKVGYKKSKNFKWETGYPTPTALSIKHLQKSKHWKKVSRSKAQPGDVEIQLSSSGEGKHTAIIVERKKNGNLVSAEASNGQFYPTIDGKDSLYHHSRVYYRYYK